MKATTTTPTIPTRPWSWPPPLTRDSLADAFARVAVQLDALQPPAITRATRHVATGNDASAIDHAPPPLLVPRERVAEILRTNARFRPAEHAQAQPPLPPQRRTPTAAATAAVGHDVHATRHAALTTGSLDATPSPPLPSPPAVTASLVPVGGRARVFQVPELARARRSLKKRGLALTNLQALASSVPTSAPLATALPSAASSMSGKQALIAELVARTSFSTQHIFHMSRTFKEMAGAAKSVISFAEFRALLSDDLGALLLAIGVDAHDAAFQELASSASASASSASSVSSSPADLCAISATISATDSFLRRLFATFDVDGDGKIDFREFVVGLHGFLKGSLDDKVDALFAAYAPAKRATATTAATGEPTVAISDLLGLFQGDRQLYQELMRAVDEYFARMELHDSDDDALTDAANDEPDTSAEELVTVTAPEATTDDAAATLGLEDFVAASLAEPRLLETIARPTPSLAFSDDAVLRTRLQTFVERRALDWRALCELQRRVLATALGTAATTRVVSDRRLPLARVVELLTEMDNSSSTSSSSSGDELHGLLRAYLIPPSSSSGVRATTPATSPSSSASSSSPLIDVAALLHDLAVVVTHATFTPTPADTEHRARFYFARFDLNGDAWLSRHELVSAVCAGFAHFGPSLTDVVRVLESEDSDMDGELTTREYLRAARRSPLILASLYTCL